MPKYRCIMRLTTDDHKTIHEVGDVVELTGDDERVAVRLGAVELVKESKPKVDEGEAK